MEPSPRPSPARPGHPLPRWGRSPPELALTCGRQGAPSGSERRAFAMPATSSAQPCMKYEIKKTRNFIPSCVSGRVHTGTQPHPLTPSPVSCPHSARSCGKPERAGSRRKSREHLSVAMNCRMALLPGSREMDGRQV